MKNTLKLAVIGAAMVATIAAQAATGRIFSVVVTQGSGGGPVTPLQQADGNVLRVTSSSSPKFDWIAFGQNLGNPTFVHTMSVAIRGSRVGSGAIGLWMFDYIAVRWTFVSTVTLPSVGLANTSLNVTNVPSRFVNFGGQFKLRFISSGPMTMIVDRLVVNTS